MLFKMTGWGTWEQVESRVLLAVEPLDPRLLWKAAALSTGWLSTYTCFGVKRTSVLTAVTKENEDETLEVRISFKEIT